MSLSLDARLQRLEAAMPAGPTHEEWVDYLAALERCDSGAHTASDKALIAAFAERLGDTNPQHVAAYLRLE
jgi:hypothetical protein